MQETMRAWVRVRAPLLAALAAAVVLSASHPASADPATHHLDIPAEDLASALKALGAATNEEVLFSADVVAGLRSTELKGEYTTDAALAILLKGSGLKAGRTATGVLLIQIGKSRGSRS